MKIFCGLRDGVMLRNDGGYSPLSLDGIFPYRLDGSMPECPDGAVLVQGAILGKQQPLGAITAVGFRDVATQTKRRFYGGDAIGDFNLMESSLNALPQSPLRNIRVDDEMVIYMVATVRLPYPESDYMTAEMFRCLFPYRLVFIIVVDLIDVDGNVPSVSLVL